MGKVKQVNIRFYLDEPLDQAIVNKLSSPYVDQTRLIKKLLVEHFDLWQSTSISTTGAKKDIDKSATQSKGLKIKEGRQVSSEKHRLNGGFKGFEATIE